MSRPWNLTPFAPHPLVPGGQLQTVIGHLTSRPAPPRNYQVLPVALPDGDKLLLHVDAAKNPRKDRTQVLLMHGLGGCSESSYILRISRKLTESGFDVVRFNHRGCGRDAAFLARQIYHAGRTDDLVASLLALSAQEPGRPLFVVAFSLSANILLRTLGEHASDLRRIHPGLSRALAVCPPVDLERCSEALSSPGNWHIDRFYTKLLLKTARERAKLFPDLEHPKLPRRLNLRLFDTHFTAPLAGFRSVTHYYDTCSAKHFVARIRVPTMVLAAADDPIIPPQSFDGVDWSPAVYVSMQSAGGHMGFLAKERTRFGDLRWMDEAVVAWAESP